MIDKQTWQPSLASYATWLDGQSPDSLRLWIARLESNDDAQAEGAIAEAVVLDYLAIRTDTVRLADIPGKGGPDFFFNEDDRSFYVEVTNISIEKATAVTSLSTELGSFQNYNNLNLQVKEEVLKKAGQFSSLDRPLVVVVSTLHPIASQLCVSKGHVEQLLYGRKAIAGKYNSEKGEVEGDLFQLATMDHSGFTRKDSLEVARRNVSAIVVGGFGCVPPTAKVRGILHPDPVRPFNPSWIDDLPFLRFKEWPLSNKIVTEWTDDTSEESD